MTELTELPNLRNEKVLRKNQDFPPFQGANFGLPTGYRFSEAPTSGTETHLFRKGSKGCARSESFKETFVPLNIDHLLKAAADKGYTPVSLTNIKDAERQLEFVLPPLIRKIYSEVGDGGFGPGYGFYGLLEGTDEFPDDLAGRKRFVVK